MQAQTKVITVTATQWFREGDHPAVTGVTRRWATDIDPDGIITDTAFAEQYGKRGMVHLGSIAESGIVVEAGDWIVEEEGSPLEVYTDEMFQKYFEPVNKAALGEHPASPLPTAAVVEVQPVLGNGHGDGEGEPAPVAAPALNDPTPVEPSPAPDR